MLKKLLIILFSISLISCASSNINKTGQGAIAGTALGAGMGAIVGGETGHAGRGTAVGAALGALGGALVGSQLQKSDEEMNASRDRLALNEEQIKENRKLIDELRSRGADAYSSKRGVVINLPDVLFEFDSANLTRESTRTIDEISGVLKTVPDRLLAVEGHTDSIGTVEYNKGLSERRAKSVARALNQEGIPNQQMRVRGFGEGSPIATNNSDAGRARNRRVEVIIENN